MTTLLPFASEQPVRQEFDASGTQQLQHQLKGLRAQTDELSHSKSAAPMALMSSFLHVESARRSWPTTHCASRRHDSGADHARWSS